MPRRSTFQTKVDLIREINDNLISNNQRQLTVDDFNKLWDLNPEELVEAQQEVSKQLKQLERYQRREKTS